MITEFDIAWLAGFIDGEGTLGLYAQAKVAGIRPVFQLANASQANIERVKTIVSEIVGRQVRFTFHFQPRPDRLVVYRITVNRKQELGPLLTRLLPYLTGKRPQAEMLLQFLAIAPGSGVGRRYDERHYAMVDAMRALNVRMNKRGGPPARDRTASPHEGEETARHPE